MEFTRFFNEEGKDLEVLLHRKHHKQDQFQKATDRLSELEEDLADHQGRIEDAITSYMKLHDLGILVLHSPHLPVEEVWLCKMSAVHGNVSMTRVAQIQACAIKETPF